MELKFPIETERCIIDELQTSTPEEYFAFLERNRERFLPTIPLKFVNVVFSLDFVRSNIATAGDDFQKLKMRRLVVRDKNTRQLIVTINFAEFRLFPDNSCSVGFLCDTQYEGKGFVKEALSAAMKWVHEAHKVRRVYAYHRVENQRSSKTLHSLGFEDIGIIKGYAQLTEEWQDHQMTSLLFEGSSLSTV